MLVMLTLGLVGMIATGTKGATDMLKSRTGFTIFMTTEVSPAEIEAVNKALSSDKSVRHFEFTSAEANMEQWNEENKLDVIRLLGINPFPADFVVRVNPEWSDPEQLEVLRDKYAALSGVDEVEISTRVIANLYRLISTVNLVLIIIAAGLLLISIVLINNTVRLTVYSRRFLIHTMKLVGAAGSFIRGPFIRSGLMSGLTAGILASGMLAGIITFARSTYPAVTDCLPWASLWWLFPAMIVVAMTICALASILATNRYLRLDYDDLF